MNMPNMTAQNLRIVATGRATPERVVTNQALTAWLDTSDEWITTRTGIAQRYISTGETTVDLATQAAQQALGRAKWAAATLDLIIVATMTPATLMPSTAAAVQGRLKAGRATGFDLSAACAGFITAMTVANQMMVNPAFQRVLVIGADTMSTLVDWHDRSTAVLFGDGAGAVLLERTPAAGPWGMCLTTDGELGAYLTAGKQQGQWATLPHPLPTLAPLTMNGRAVYKFATHRVPAAIEQALAQAGVTKAQIDHFLLHQANARIIAQVAKRLGQPAAKFPLNIDRYGNTAAASEPILLDECIQTGRLLRGDRLVLSGFGGGLSTATIVMQY